MDHVIDTRDENCPILCYQFPQEGDEGGHGFVYGSAEDTRVEVASWAGDFNEHIRQAAEAIGDTRSTGVEPVVVGLMADSVRGSRPLRKPNVQYKQRRRRGTSRPAPWHAQQR